MTFPRPPLETIDWDNLGFDALEVNGHIESYYSTSTGHWSAPVFVKDPVLRIHGLAPCLNYGQQAFEGLKAHRSPNNTILLFRPLLNALRLAHSSRFVTIPAVPHEHFLRCLHLCVGLNSEFVPPHHTAASLYLRALCFATSASPGLRIAADYTFCIYALPVGPLHGSHAAHAVDALVVDDFDRCAPLGTGSAKLGGNYGPMLGILDQARAKGYGLTLHLDSATHTAIDEFSTSAFIGVKLDGATAEPDRAGEAHLQKQKEEEEEEEEKYTLVVSDSDQIVASITCDSVCEIARSFGWTVEKRRIGAAELGSFDQVFAAGTAAVLVPVRSIEHGAAGRTFRYGGNDDDDDDDDEVKGGEARWLGPRSCYGRLVGRLRGIQTGRGAGGPDGWVEVVREPEGEIGRSKEKSREGE